MTGFRVAYSRGSFAFTIACDTREQALARAVSIAREPGVWHVQIEDAGGRLVALVPELKRAAQDAAAPVVPLRAQPAKGLRSSRAAQVKFDSEELPE